jgi:hypothetical protein
VKKKRIDQCPVGEPPPSTVGTAMKFFDKNKTMKPLKKWDKGTVLWLLYGGGA